MYIIHMFMFHLATGSYSEKRVIRQFCHCASIVVCTETNLGDTSQGLRMAAYCSHHTQRA